MREAVSYRLAMPDDGAGMLAVHLAAIEAIDTAFYDAAIKKSWAFGLTAQGYATSMAEGEVFQLALDERQQIVGFCGIKANEIFGLYVHPETQGRGVGRALLIDGESRLKDSGVRASELVASLNAQAFYAAHGWTFVEHRTKKSRGGLEQRLAVMRKVFAGVARSATDERAWLR